MDFVKTIKVHLKGPIQILDAAIPLSKYTPIDLSAHNGALRDFDITEPNDCQAYIDSILKPKDTRVAFGGYLEERGLYAKSIRFSEGTVRNIHLGCDFWSVIGTKVIVPYDGTIHSFKNNDDPGNYGPTIVLKHKINGFTFHSLYGHLSLESLNGLYQGKEYLKGETLGDLGSSKVNGGYAPHLHFQLILSMDGHQGDYPGVCDSEDLNYYRQNCPDPYFLLGIRI